jgi:hypothetical protein
MVMAPSVALAQTQPLSNGGPAAAASGSDYQSAFADYKPYTEPVVMSWREANNLVRDTGGMQGHDMAKMKLQSDDPHAGHDMSKMGAKPVAPAPAGPASASSAETGHATHGARKAPPEDPHAGHDMSKLTPAKAAAPAPAKPRAPSAAEKTGPSRGAMKAVETDPHAGHDMPKMGTTPGQNVPVGTDKSNHGAHGAPPAAQAKNKREKE